MKNEKLEVVAGYYFLSQGFAGLVWLFLISSHAEVRDLFTPVGFPPAYLLAIRLPDLLLFVGGSLSTGYLIRAHSSKAVVFSAATFGAVAYATLLTVATSLVTGSAVLGSLLMGLSLLGTSFATLGVVKG